MLRRPSCLLGLLLLAAAPARAQSAYEQMQTFSSLMNQIRASYVDSVSYGGLIAAAVDGVLSGTRAEIPALDGDPWPVVHRLPSFDVIELATLREDHLDELLRRADDWLTALDTLGVHRRRIVAVEPIFAEAKLIPLCRRNDRVVLVIKLGETLGSAAERTIELLGRERIAGAIAVQ